MPSESAVVGEINEKVRSPWTNAAVIAGIESLTALSKIGTKDKGLLKRLTKMIVWANKAIEEYFVTRDTLLNTWAEKDENDEIRVRTIADSKGNEGQTAVMKNGIEFNLRSSELLREVAKFDVGPPEPFTWKDLESFQRFPDASVVAGLGPFVHID